jgi:hypothetical protein
MRGRLLCLLLAFILDSGGIATPGVWAESNPPLKLVPDTQQVQSAPTNQGQPPGGVTLHDIRGPVELPDSSGLLFWLVIGLAVVVISGLFLYLWKRRKKGERPPSPHESALTELTRLRPMMNPEQALIYAAQLAELLRRYVEVRFQIHSTRQTTREFFAGLVRNPQAAAVNSMADHRDHLRECLEQCDMAKFAHCIPAQQEMEAMEQAVRSFIEATGQPTDTKGKG